MSSPADREPTREPPKPYYQDEFVTLYHGDCREVVPALSLAHYALVTDPPYGHGKKWSGGTWAANPLYDDCFDWDAEAFPLDALLLLIAGADEAIVWGGNYYALPPSRCWLAWRKVPSMQTMADFELAWTNFDRPAALLEKSRNPDGARQHPTQKPLSIMLWALGFTAPERCILDPFAGSGTTLVAAKQLNRRAIGVELSERYCQVVAARLSQSVLDLGGAA